MSRLESKGHDRRAQLPGHWTIILLVMVLLGLVAGPVRGAEEAPLDGLQAYDYARQLLRDGDVSGARAELKRFLFFCPTEARVSEARQLLANLEAGTTPGAESSVSGKSAESSGGKGVATAVIHLYQDHLRTFRRPGASCPSYPSCSAYTLQAVEKHGAILGAFMFVDRFWREVTTAGQPPQVMLDGRKLHYDPLAENDYWLAHQGGSGN